MPPDLFALELTAVLVPAALDDLTAVPVLEPDLLVAVLAEERVVPALLALELERTVELAVEGRAVLLEVERVVPLLTLELERVVPVLDLPELERTEPDERVAELLERVALLLPLERVLLLTVPPTDLEVVAERVVLPEEREMPLLEREEPELLLERDTLLPLLERDEPELLLERETLLPEREPELLPPRV